MKTRMSVFNINGSDIRMPLAHRRRIEAGEKRLRQTLKGFSQKTFTKMVKREAKREKEEMDAWMATPAYAEALRKEAIAMKSFWRLPDDANGG